MDKLNSMTAQELSNLNIQGINIAAPYGTLLGEPERNAVMFIWGGKGAGKSTFSLGLANALAQHGRVEYIPAEEHFGKTLVDRVKRLDATHENLNFTKWKSVEALKDALQKNNSSFCVLDSITVIDANDHATVELAQWCRESGIGFIMVAHATKDGRYKGNTSIAHECDIEIKVTMEGTAETEKNRYKSLSTVDVPFTAADMGATTPGTPKPFAEEDQSIRKISKADNYPPGESRENPVDVPFRMSLKEIDKLHKFRSWRRINSLMGSKMPCYAKKHSGESQTPHFSIRYTPDYRQKKYVLELLLDGRLENQICSEGAKGGFKPSWRKLVAEHGDIEVMIYSQDHAKKVLGAKEYKKQERAYAKSMKQGKDCPPEQTSKTPEKLVDKIKRYNLPEVHGDYFQLSAGSQLVPLDKVIARKKNSEKSIEKALNLMKKAADGNNDKRKPVTVYRKGDTFIVVDGNATTAVAKRSSWNELPVTQVDAPQNSTSKKKPKKSSSIGTSSPKQAKPEKKPAQKKSGGIDIEAARKSQSKLDSFLEKVLS